MKNINHHEIGSLIPKIDSICPSLSKSERIVAEYVLKNAEKVVYCSISDLAEIVGVGDTTVLRFCRKIGYKGYQSFKVALAQDITFSLSEDAGTNSNEITNKDSVWDVSQKTLNYTIKALNETLSLLAKEDIEKAVNLIVNARKIEFFGVGTSAITALDAMCRFARIGLEVGSIMDGHLQTMKAALLSPQDLAIAFSFSGSTKDTVEVLALAKKTGAKTICITHHARSPITKYADIVLLNGSKEDPLQGGAITTKVSQLLVIDILYTNVFLKIRDKAVKNKEKTSKAVMEKLF